MNQLSLRIIFSIHGNGKWFLRNFILFLWSEEIIVIGYNLVSFLRNFIGKKCHVFFNYEHLILILFFLLIDNEFHLKILESNVWLATLITIQTKQKIWMSALYNGSFLNLLYVCYWILRSSINIVSKLKTNNDGVRENTKKRIFLVVGLGWGVYPDLSG